MKRLRIGVSITVAQNAGVYAVNVTADKLKVAIDVITGLNVLGFFDGKIIGKVFGMPVSLVLSLS